jgi:hypothetical protein
MSTPSLLLPLALIALIAVARGAVGVYDEQKDERALRRGKRHKHEC